MLFIKFRSASGITQVRILNPFAFVRCETEQQEGRHSHVVDSRPQERDLNLELMHAGRLYNDAKRKAIVIPKMLYSYTYLFMSLCKAHLHQKE